ncbi:MAG: hypothetical protein ACTSYI_10890 [Promethearchaeota archaeon]
MEEKLGNKDKKTKSNENPFSGLHLNQPNFDNYKIHGEEHKKRVEIITKELQGVYTISEKTLNKRFTI